MVSVNYTRATHEVEKDNIEITFNRNAQFRKSLERKKEGLL